MAKTERPYPGIWRVEGKRKWNLTINHNGRHNYGGYTDAKATMRLREDILRLLERKRAGEPIDTRGFNEVGLQILAKLGVINLATQELRTADCRALAKRYQEVLTGRNRSPEYVKTTHTYIIDMIEATGFSVPNDLAPDPAEQHLNDLVKAGLGLATRSRRRTAFVSWADWLIDQGLRRDNPFTSIPVLNAKTDVRRKLRYIDDDEFVALLDTTLKRRCYRTLCNEDRRLVYLIGRYGGLRASEIARLSPRHLDLDTEPPAVVLSGAETKNGQPVRQPIPKFLANELRPLLQRPAGKRLFPGKWYRRAAEMLKDDLEAAGISVADKRGAVADFHALRHSFITSMRLAGIEPEVAQVLSRHSDIRLTMEVYNHAADILLSGAVEKLVSPCIPSFIPSPHSEPQSSAAGTESEGEEKGEAEAA